MATTLLAWASDPELRRNGSSGGFIRAMLIHLLQTKAVDRVLYARTGPKEGGFHPAYATTDDPDELRDRRTASVYHPVDVTALAWDYSLTYAGVVRPCCVSAFRKDLAVAFELLCHHVPMPDWTYHLSGLLGVKYPANVAYRGNGWPGELTMGDVTVPHTKYWSNDKWLPPDCKLCKRTHSPDTDFVCGDPWGYKGEMGDGKTMVLAQTEQAEKLLEQAIAAGVIATEPLDRAFWDKRIRNHRK